MNSPARPQPLAALPRTRIKMCGFTREADVDAAVAAGADALGFVLYAKSPRAVTAERAGELARRLPPFVTPVLLFVNPSANEVRAGCAAVPGAACCAASRGIAMAGDPLAGDSGSADL